jgi:uncharacterized protein with ATP-grasp and redox domains
MKLGIEAIEEFLIFDPEAKALLQTEQASERIAEVKALLEIIGVDAPGLIIFSLALTQFKQFKREFESAELIFAKGMGHYEALSELPSEGRFFYCLRAKY